MYYSKKLGSYIFESLENLNDALDSQTSILNNYVYDKIKYTIDNDCDHVILFYIKIDKVLYHVKLKLSDLVSPLKKCLSKFEEIENYEKCIECRDLIERITI